MATIYEKLYNRTGELLDRMLVLEPREALIYPFDFGDDWTELRMAAGLSIVNNGSSGNFEDLDKGYSEGLQRTNTSQSFYFGFIGWTGDISEFYGLPATNGARNGTSFIGVLSNPNYTDSSNVVATNATRFYHSIGGIETKLIGIISDSGFYSGVVNDSSIRNAMIFPGAEGGNNWPTGNTNFTIINGVAIKYNANSNTMNFAGLGFASDYAYSSDPTILETRRLAGGIVSPSILWDMSGTHYTHNFTPGGIPQLKPKAVIIYSPFYNCRLRVSSLVVERFG